MPAKLFAEFLGTYLLVFTVGCNVITGTAAWSVTSIACVLMVSIYAMGNISGGHFNPAVSFAIFLSKDVPDFTVAVMGRYMLAQFAGGLLGSVTYALIFWDVFNLAPAEGFNWLHAGVAEFLYTFLLVFCVLNTAVSPKSAGKGNEYPAMAIAFSVIAGGYGAGHISGGCFNPAVALAIDLSSWNAGFFYCLPYIVFELAGAGLAVVVYKQMEQARETEARGQRLLAEFVGTFFLVLTVGLNVLGGSKAPVWSIAASLMCVIYCMGDVSGGHFNPAVTMAVSIAKIPGWKQQDGFLYIVAQTLGGLVGALVYSLLERGQVFPLAPGAGHTWGAAYLGEFAFTFMLCYVVLGVACVDHAEYPTTKQSFFAFAIASCVTAGGYAIGALSGGSLNPAVSISISLSSIGRGHGIFHVFPYVIFELLAGATAGVAFRFTHAAWIEKQT